ncbi:hypothetical protein LCGC14_0469670 [marine sediment metagenome]|uniref:Uncharacterized protein n=1 Tax=marine sediment metagenome TaxID=412755 RepID=A0A0F9SVE3_9ZZZZ
MTQEKQPPLDLLGIKIPFVPKEERYGTLAIYEKKSPIVAVGETKWGQWYAFLYLRQGSVKSISINTGTHGTAQDAVDCLADQILMMKCELSVFDAKPNGQALSMVSNFNTMRSLLNEIISLREQVTNLQKRGTELVEENRELKKLYESTK